MKPADPGAGTAPIGRIPPVPVQASSLFGQEQGGCPAHVRREEIRVEQSADLTPRPNPVRGAIPRGPGVVVPVLRGLGSDPSSAPGFGSQPDRRGAHGSPAAIHETAVSRVGASTRSATLYQARSSGLWDLGRRRDPGGITISKSRHKALSVSRYTRSCDGMDALPLLEPRAMTSPIRIASIPPTGLSSAFPMRPRSTSSPRIATADARLSPGPKAPQVRPERRLVA